MLRADLRSHVPRTIRFSAWEAKARLPIYWDLLLQRVIQGLGLDGDKLTRVRKRCRGVWTVLLVKFFLFGVGVKSPTNGIMTPSIGPEVESPNDGFCIP